jgi:hypothetical protein
MLHERVADTPIATRDEPGLSWSELIHGIGNEAGCISFCAGWAGSNARRNVVLCVLGNVPVRAEGSELFGTEGVWVKAQRV